MTQHVCRVVVLCAVVAFGCHAVDAWAEVVWSIERGWLTAREGDVSLMGSAPGWAVDATVDDRPLLVGQEVIPEISETSDGGFSVSYRAQRGTLRDLYVPFPELGDHAWLRTVVYENTTGSRQDLTGVQMRLAPAAVPASPWRTRDFWMAAMTPNTALCVSYRGEADHYELDEESSGIPVHRVRACWRLQSGQSARVGQQGIWLGAPGSEAWRGEARRWYSAIGLHTTTEVPEWLRGTILYQTSAGGHVEARFSNVGGFDRLATQVDYLADLGVTAVWLQAVHQHKSPPDPVQGGWNCYDPRDFSRIDPILGGVEGLNRLTRAFRDRGLQVLGEIVPHGGRSVQAQALESWWTRGRDGQPQRNWGGYGMDYASPAWQTAMRDAAAMLAREAGVVGLRVDVADGSGPNWGSTRTAHASFSGLGGAVELLAALQQGLRDGGTSAGVLIPEAPNTVEFFALAPVGYDHHGWFLMGREIPALIQDPQAMRNRLRDYFENTRGTLPPGALVLRTLNNHDTVVESGRVHYRYGAGLARALYGVCLMVEGIPMLYQEEEKGSFQALRTLNWARRRIPEFATGTPDYLSVDFAPEVFACVRLDEQGSAVGLSNLSAVAIDGVVALPDTVMASDGTQVVDGVTGRTAVVQDGGFPWRLEPYETALIRIGRPLLPGPAAEGIDEPPRESEPLAPLRVTADEDQIRFEFGELIATFAAGRSGDDSRGRESLPDDDGPDGVRVGRQRLSASTPFRRLAVERLSPTHVRIECQMDDALVAPELVVFHADRWRVSGRTALLDDRVLRRSYPFPPEANYVWDRTMAWGRGPHGSPYRGVAPVGRLWESVLEPLHPESGGLAWSDRRGRSLLICGIDTSAAHLVLTDRTDEQPDVPYGLALRFYSKDPDLDPTVASLGLGHPLVLDAPGKSAEQPVRLSFQLHGLGDHEVTDRLTATRLPVDRGEPVFRTEGPDVRRQHDSIWFVQPGAAIWEQFPAVAGRYRLRVELRHSEVSESGTDQADAYRLEIDGRDLRLDWVSMNTYRTGNAYFGHVLSEPVDLSAGMCSLKLAASKNWAAVRGKFHLVPSDEND